MFRRIASAIMLILILCGIATADSYQFNADSLRRHVEILASDSMEGRETGEAGEMMAARYISGVFEQAGLHPGGNDGGWLQSFEFTKRVDFGPSNRLAINGIELQVGEEFRPLLQSASLEFSFDSLVSVGYGIVTDDSSHNDYAAMDVSGQAVLIMRHTPEIPESETDVDSATADSTARELDRYASIADKILTAIQHDAAGVFLITPTGHDDTLPSIGAVRIKPKDVPVIWLRRTALERLELDLDSPKIKAVEGETELVRVRDTGYNVVGILQGSDERSVIIGAHYDHLGWGGEGSRYRGEEKKIHFGADDNGSGTATLLELARYFAAANVNLNHTKEFVAFSGEEKGVLGSSHFAEAAVGDDTSLHMMVNIDMVGRLADQEKGLAVMGTGTCEEFKGYFDSLDQGDMKLAFKESGQGPSDHSPFYNRGVPVLFFFTGAHDDYHTPADLPDRLDYEGLVSVAELISEVTSHFDRRTEPLTFARTKGEPPGGRRPSLSVTLGIMPDFISEVEGLGVDGVSPDRPADRAGVHNGDIIIKLGKYDIDDIYTYMNSLAKFRKGDSTEVVVVREADTLTLPLVFE